MQQLTAQSPTNFSLDGINFIFAEINYGGRITDSIDQRLLKSILLHYFSAPLPTLTELLPNLSLLP